MDNVLWQSNFEADTDRMVKVIAGGLEGKYLYIDGQHKLGFWLYTKILQHARKVPSSAFVSERRRIYLVYSIGMCIQVYFAFSKCFLYILPCMAYCNEFLQIVPKVFSFVGIPFVRSEAEP